MIPLADVGSSESAFEWSSLAFILAGFFLAVVVPFLVRRAKKEEETPAGPVRDQWEQFKAREKSSKQADRVLVELVETSREISARMDTKIRILNTLIRDAERCIERLEELRGLPSSTPGRSGPAPGDGGAADRDGARIAAEPPSPGSTPQPDAPPAAEAAPRASQQPTQARSPAEPTAPGPAANGATNTGSPEQEEEEPSPSAPPWGSDVAHQVIELLEGGRDVPEVARELGLSRQEVVLIQRLHQQRKGS
jgi:hypothetical protein